MTTKPPAPKRPFFLGIEGGGTHTVALLANANGALMRRVETGPGNLRLLSDTELLKLLRSVAANLPRPDALAIGMAGARTGADLERIRAAAARVWKEVPCHASDDLETALQAADNDPAAVARVLVLSGTGSCCYGRSASGKTARVGGWGHVLGDRGSAYDIAIGALRNMVADYDRSGVLPLGQAILRHLQLNEPPQLINWAQAADKAAVAALAVVVFRGADSGDRMAREIVDGAARALADDALACARRLVKPSQPVQFIPSGGTLLKQPRFARRVTALLRKNWRGAHISPLSRESAWGAVMMARALLRTKDVRQGSVSGDQADVMPDAPLSEFARQSPTEQRNPRSRNLDKMPLSRAIALMLSEDARVPGAILKERPNIERAVRLIVRAFQRGGRLFYVGAGTSGRLGVLDASECPPTFRADPEMVQGIIAGGQTALWSAAEGAEDDADAGARAVDYRGVGRRDVVVGIAASGRTPFVWGALGEAKRRGATTVLLAFNPFLSIPNARRPDVVITPNVGPEVLTGSTRLKAGTATKLILNIFTTLAMVRMGKVVGNLMVDVKPTNTKLRDRAVRIVRELSGADYATARAALERSGWRIKDACARLRGR
jgi:N-acetylmuramic acid 6-phosphate etherase